MLVNMFYVLPFYGLAIYALIFPGCSWLHDWALVFAGAIGQVRWGGVGYVGPVLRKVSACSSIAFVLTSGDARPLTGSQDFLVLERKMGQTHIPHPMKSELNRVGIEAERDSRGAELLKEGAWALMYGYEFFRQGKAFQEWEQHKEMHRGGQWFRQP